MDEEVARLPAHLRAAVVLCDLEGQSQQDAARLLGWSEGSLRGRLARARRRLRDRLERRGLAPALLPAGAPLLFDEIPVTLSQSLLEATTRAATASVLAVRSAPLATGIISTSFATLVKGVIHAMALSKVKLLGSALILATVGLLAVVGLVRAGLSGSEISSLQANPASVAHPDPAGRKPEAVENDRELTRLEVQVVRHTDRRPIPGTTVVIYGLDSYNSLGVRVASMYRSERLADERGFCVFDVPKGRSELSLVTIKDGFAPAIRDIVWQPATGFYDRDGRFWPALKVRQGVATVTQELGVGQTIGGFVKDEQGRPIADAEVVVVFGRERNDSDTDAPQPSIGTIMIGDQLASPCVRVKSDDQGRWRCSSLPEQPDPGMRLLFRVRHPDHLSDTGVLLRRLSLKTARAMTGVLPMKSGVSVGGQVRDSRGAPVPDARVVIWYSSHLADFLVDRTDSEGRFVFPHVNDEPPLGRCMISVEAPGLAPDRKAIAPRAQMPRVDFRLSPGKPFHGRVVDKEGRPVAGVTVTAGERLGYRLGWRVETDAEGRFQRADAPSSGPIDFDLHKPEYRVARWLRDPGAARQADLTIEPEGGPGHGLLTDEPPVIPDGMFEPADDLFGRIIDAAKPFVPSPMRWLIRVLRER